MEELVGEEIMSDGDAEPSIYGNRGATPIVGSCYVCRDQKRKRRKTRKGCVACVQPVCDEHSITKTKCITCDTD
ncbi:unnamed protein product [Clavelina lepadiformis]|uniref:PiggyBac transposable element-derived protein 4 C-terminal zinc-ribbon domain-containing protein n=1 Tax=Clavelina lepadiformis TaxID=159417 RepID=A0ABP0H288_CLALP